MPEQTIHTLFTDHLEDNPPAQKLAWAMAVVRRAREEQWAPGEVARTLQMLGLDTLPLVRRMLTRHGYDASRPGEPPDPPAANLLAAVLTISLADDDDSSVLAVLETTEDGAERVDLLTRDGVAPAMAAAYAGLDATLLRLAYVDPGAALDGIAARASHPGPGEAA